MKISKFIFIFIFILVTSKMGYASVVCANGSSETNCDYQCDGVNDEAEIMQAQDALPPDGGIIHLSAGDFKYGNQINIIKDNVTIRGEGKNTKLTADTNLGAGVLIYGIYISASNATLEDFWLDGGGIDYYNSVARYLIHSIAPNTKIDNLVITNAGTDGTVFSKGSVDGVVSNTFYDYIYRSMNDDQSAAMEVEDGAKRITFKNNKATNSKTCMFPHVHNNRSAVEDIKFIDNVCIRGIGGHNNAQITVNTDSLQGETSVSFIRNHYIGTGMVVGSSNPNHSIMINIHGDKVTDSLSHGITISQNTRGRIRDVEILNAGDRWNEYGIFIVLADISIDNAYVSGSYDNGIVFATAEGELKSSILKNNGIESNRQQLRIWGESRVSIHENSIYGNQGIKLGASSGTQKTTITNNYIEGLLEARIIGTGQLILKYFENDIGSTSLGGDITQYSDNNHIVQ